MDLVAESVNIDMSSNADDRIVTLELIVTDADVVNELRIHRSGERNEYALAALKVGVLAIRQASGVVDAKTIQQECNRLLGLIHSNLSSHAESFSRELAGTLGKFFDPSNGEFSQRFDRLIRHDGELESLLNKHLNGDGSHLTQTLEKHIGSNSPLLQMLSPDQKKGIIAALAETVDQIMREHRNAVSSQFSLDDKESALSRLLSEITEKNGSLRKSLAVDLEAVRREFSLDNDGGALARLVARVDSAHKSILGEFSADNGHSALSRMTKLLEGTNNRIETSLSLDVDHSPLFRLRRELLNVFTEIDKSNKEFQEQVRVTLESIKTRRDEAARSTSHGMTFQQAVGKFIQKEAQRLGDLCIETGDEAGSISRCKVGDFVLALGPETAAPDSRVVFEAKENKSYNVKDALIELKTARENRRAQVGVFVFSRATAPHGLESLNRWGQDIVVVWDGEDVASDVYFKAAISMARLMVVQELMASREKTACVTEMDAAVGTLTRDIAVLDDITRLAQTVKNNGENIIAKVDSLRKKVDKQLETLRQHIGAMRADKVT